jgi:hypothetical protein
MPTNNIVVSFPTSAIIPLGIAGVLMYLWISSRNEAARAKHDDLLTQYVNSLK